VIEQGPGTAIDGLCRLPQAPDGIQLPVGPDLRLSRWPLTSSSVASHRDLFLPGRLTAAAERECAALAPKSCTGCWQADFRIRIVTGPEPFAPQASQAAPG
jgi:hypothetical protein